MTRLARLAAIALALGAPALAEERPLGDLLEEAWRKVRGGAAAEGRALFEEGLVRAIDGGDAVAHSNALRGIAAACTRLGDYATARARLDDALPIAQGSGDRVELGRVWNALGTVSWYQDRSQSKGFFERAMAEFEAAGDFKESANTLANLMLGMEPDDADRAIERGLLLADRAGDAYVRGRFLHARGDILRGRGDFAAARANLLEAQRLFIETGRKEPQVTVLNSLAFVHRLHGRPEQALAYQREALERAREMADPYATIQSIAGVALALYALERQDEALRMIEEGLALAGSSQLPTWHDHLRDLQADIELARGQPRRALEALARVSDREPMAQNASGRESSRACALRRLGRPAQALAAAERAVGYGRASQLDNVLMAALIQRAHALAALGRTEEALRDGREALARIEQVRTMLVPTDPMRRGFGDRGPSPAVLVVKLLQRAGRSEEALEVAMAARSRAFLDLLAERGASPGRAPRPGPTTIADVRGTAARLDSTVLVYFVGSDEAYVWAVPATGPIATARVPASPKRLASLVDGADGANSSMARRGPALATRAGGLVVLGDESARWARLYDLLVRPVRASLPRAGARLTVVADGPLLRLPFGALRDGSGRYLVERYAIHYAPAVGAVARAPERHADTERVLLVGDPESYPDPGDGTSLRPLPGSRRELDGIARLLGSDRVERLQGGDATEALLRERVRGASALHFSTHGVVRDDAPLESFVALAPGTGGDDDDGRLTTADVYGLDLPADLVFLSACRTGRGGVSADGVLGLTRAFFHAGTASIVATLSDVVDETAQRLVADFYRARVAGRDKATALREAQLAMLRDLRAGRLRVDTPAGSVVLPESPALWAPFVLLGEP